MSSDQNRLKKISEARQTRANEVEVLKLVNEVLTEDYQAATDALLSLRAEDEGWLPFNTMREHDGFAVRHLHLLYEKSKLQTKTNALLKQGLSLRTAYVWGRGIKFDGDIKPRYQKLIDKNFHIIFSQSAFAALERSLYTAGNIFMAYRRSDQRVFQIPFLEITNFASDADLNTEVRYFQRTWRPVDPTTGAPAKEPIIEWYPLWETVDQASPRSPVLNTIADQRVNADIVVIDVRVNKDADEIWGVPDCLPAMPYAWAHAEYLKDGSKLLKALSTIAWKVVSKSKGNAQNAGAKVAEVRRSAGVANMTQDTDLVAMPKSGQVDLADGDRIASYVASALGVSLTALLSTASAAGGSYGAEASLDTPQQNAALARQAVWRDEFYRRILAAMGMPPEISVIFRSITEDPAYRSVQTLTLAFQTGAIFQDEYRDTLLDLADIEPLHPEEELPTPNAFTGAQQTNIDAIAQAGIDLQKDTLDLQKKQAADQAKIQQQQVSVAKQQAQNNPLPKQGNSGGVGKMNQGDNTNRDQAHKPGTGSVKP